ncbi:MAG: hypothetical protein PHD48_12685 [Alphaproteobacteria bacterium]|nr:hypothetical protein [Alphaproteobacteria bacterium]
MNAPEFAAHQKAALVQVLGDFLHAHTRAFFAVDIEREDFADNLGFGGVNIQFLFQSTMRSCASRFNRPITEGSLRPVEITLSRIFIHAAQSVLGVLFALVFIKHHQHALQHVRHRIIAKLLRDGNKINACLA